MTTQDFLDSLEDLTGKVAIVTGGSNGIGLQTTTLLARKNCTVYVASRSESRSLRAISDAETALAGRPHGPIKFHLLDLASIEGAKASAREFCKRENRLDILVTNAGVGMIYRDELSVDGYERAFATNHLGHFAFVQEVLGLIKETANRYGDARVVVVGAKGYKMADKIDYDILTTVEPTDGSRWWHYFGVFVHYARTKLVNLYFMKELDRRLRDEGARNVYCNACHPGVTGDSGFGSGSLGPGFQWVERTIRGLVNSFANTVEDSAKTQVWLAASRQVKERDIHGQYWVPLFSWRNWYLNCQQEELNPVAKDEKEQRKLWEFSEKALEKAEREGGVKREIVEN